MIKQKNLRNVTEEGNLVSSAECKYFEDLSVKRKMETLNGIKALNKFDKRTNKKFKKIFNIDEENPEIEINVSHFGNYYYDRILLDRCSFNNCSIDSYVSNYMNDSLLLFKEMKTFYCPKCNTLHPFEDVIGELSCCGLKSVYLNGSTKSNDTLIFTKVKNKPVDKKEDKDEIAKAHICCSGLENFYIVKRRSDVKHRKNGFMLFIDNEKTDIIVDKADIGSVILINNDIIRTFNKKESKFLTEGALNKFTEDALLSNYEMYVKESVCDFIDCYGIDITINLKLMELIIRNKDLMESVFSKLSKENNNDKTKGLSVNIKNKNKFSLFAYANNFGDIDDNITSFEFVKLVTLGRIIPSDENSANILSEYLVNIKPSCFSDYNVLFENLKENNMYQRYGDVYTNFNGVVSFFNKIKKYPLTPYMFSCFSKKIISNKLYKRIFGEVTEKEFKTIIKHCNKDGLYNSIGMDEYNLKLYVIGGYEFALKYIEKYGIDNYNKLGKQFTGWNFKNLKNKGNENVNRFFDLIFNDVSKSYAFASINEDLFSWTLEELIEQKEKMEIFVNLMKDIYIGKFTASFVNDFFELKEQAELIYPNLRGRKINYDRIVLEHDYYLQMIRNNKRDLTSVFKDRYETFKPFRMTVKNTKFIIEAPRDMNDLIKEGTELSHCVDTYGNVLETGKEMVLFVREKRGVPLYTISLDKNGNVCQSSGKSHSTVPAEILVDLQRVIATDEKKLKAVKAFFK